MNLPPLPKASKELESCALGHPQKHIFDRFILFSISGINCDEHEYRLTKYLLSNYESTVRPVKNSSEPIEVKKYLFC